MENYYPIRKKPSARSFKKGDLLVLFGELFNRGYANGLVEEAEKQGLTVVRATVGRRDENSVLRALTPEECEKIPKPFINIPLEAGFDLEKDEKGLTPNDYLKDVKLSLWQTASIPEETLNFSRNKARLRLRKNTQEFARQLEQYIQPGQHVHFAHLMAGGVPRCKIVMPLMNRVFKGIGDRFISSEDFWKSGIGRYMESNFHEVTAETFNILIDETTALREKIKSLGGTTSYVAFGYHGTEVIIEGQYRWQSYSPYLQGWAKKDLENFSASWFKKGISCCVYNCPEILTNSSSIFQGIEIALYNLVRSLKKDKPQLALTQKILEECKKELKSDDTLTEVFNIVDRFFKAPPMSKACVFEGWPHHSNKEQLALTLKTSDDIIALHKDEKFLMTNSLSELIFRSCGFIMLHEGSQPKNSVAWIGHDGVVDCLD